MFLLELGVLRCSWERNDVADVLHSGDEKDEAFEAEAEAGVGTTAPAAGVEIPPKMGHIHLSTGDLSHELVVVGFAD